MRNTRVLSFGLGLILGSVCSFSATTAAPAPDEILAGKAGARKLEQRSGPGYDTWDLGPEPGTGGRHRFVTALSAAPAPVISLPGRLGDRPVVFTLPDGRRIEWIFDFATPEPLLERPARVEGAPGETTALADDPAASVVRAEGSGHRFRLRAPGGSLETRLRLSPGLTAVIATQDEQFPDRAASRVKITDARGATLLGFDFSGTAGSAKLSPGAVSGEYRMRLSVPSARFTGGGGEPVIDAATIPGGSWGGYQCYRANGAGALPGYANNNNPYTLLYTGELPYSAGETDYHCDSYLLYDLAVLSQSATVTGVWLWPANVVAFNGTAVTHNITVRDVDNGRILESTTGYDYDINYYNDFGSMAGGGATYGSFNVAAAGDFNLQLSTRAVQDANNRLRNQNYFAVGLWDTQNTPGNYVRFSSGASALYVYYYDYAPAQVNMTFVSHATSSDEVWLYNFGDDIVVDNWVLRSTNWVPTTQSYTIPATTPTLKRHQGLKIVDGVGVNTPDTIYTGGGVFTWSGSSITPYDIQLSLLDSAGNNLDYFCWGDNSPAPPAGAGWNSVCEASTSSSLGRYARTRDSDTDRPNDWVNAPFGTYDPAQPLQPGMLGTRRRSDVFLNHFLIWNTGGYNWLSLANYGPTTNLTGWTLSIYDGQGTYGTLSGTYTFGSTSLNTGDVVWLAEGTATTFYPGSPYGDADTLHKNLGFDVNWETAPRGGEIILRDEAGNARDYLVFGDVAHAHQPPELNWIGPFIPVNTATHSDVIRDSDLSSSSALGWVLRSSTSSWALLGPNANGPLRVQDETGSSANKIGFYSYGAAGFGAGEVINVTQQVGLEEFAVQGAPVARGQTGQLVIKKQGAGSLFRTVNVTVAESGNTWVRSGVFATPLVLDPGTYAFMLYLNGDWYSNQLNSTTERPTFGTAMGVTRETSPTPTTAFSVTFSTYHAHVLYSVIHPPVITSATPLPTGVQGIAYSFSHTSTGGHGTARTWTIISGSLPAGLTMSTAGVVSGTPTVSGIFDFTVQVTDAGGLSRTQVEQLTVNVPLGIATNALPVYDNYNAPYSYTLQPLGGLAPYTWSIFSGALPAGLTLSAAGVISGTTGAVGNGTYNVTYRVIDGNGQVATKLLGLQVYRTPSILTLQLANGYVSMNYGTQRLEAYGGSGAESWAVTAGALPAGLTLGNDTTGGYITGTPTTAGTANVTLTYTNAGGSTARAYTIQIFAVSAVPPYWIRRGLSGGSMERMFFSPNFALDGTVAAIAGGSLYISSDSGYFWRPMKMHGYKVLNPNTGKYVSDSFFNVEFHPAFDGRPGGLNHTLVASASESGLWISTNLDVTWTRLNFTCASDFRYQPGNATTAYCIAWNAALGTNVMHRTTGGLANWQPIATQGLKEFFISPTFTSDNTMFAYDSGDPQDTTRYYLYRSTDGGFHWVLMQNLGPKWATSEVQFSPNYATDRTILFTFPNFVGTIGELVKISHDGGQSVVTQGAYSGVSNVVFAPDYNITSNRKLYAAQTDYYDTQIGGGGSVLAVSTDDGLSFRPTGTGGLPPGRFAGPFYLSAAFLTDNLIFAFGYAGQGIARSQDGGATWGPSDSGLYILPISAVAFAPNYSGGTGKSFVGTDSGLFYSSNGGKVWKGAGLPVGLSDITSIVVTPNFAGSNTVYASARSGSSNRLLRSVDGGLTFSDFSALPSSVYYPGELRISPNFAVDNTLFVSGSNLYKSTNAGSTFIALDPGNVAGSVAFGVSPGYAADFSLYVNDFQFVGGRRSLASYNGGTTFTSLLTAPLGDDPPAFAPNYNRVAALSGTNHTFFWNCKKTVNAGTSFTNLAVYGCGDIGVSPNYPADATFFSHHTDYTGGTISGLFKFTGGGVSYSQVMPAANPTAFDHVNQFVLSPAYGTDQTLMVATGAGLYISNNGGVTFELSSGTEAFSKQITAVAQDPNTAGRLYVGSADLGIIRSDDDGITSTPINTGLPAGPVNALFALGNPTRLVAAVKTGSVGTTGLYYSGNLGASWQLRALCDGRKFELQGTILYAACADRPGWYSSDNGFGWSALGSQVSDGTAITYSALAGPTFLTGEKADPKLPAGNTASLWSASGGSNAWYSLNNGASWIAAPGSNDYTLPAASGWTAVQPLGINVAANAREVLIGHNAQGLFRSIDGGVTWRNVSGPGSGLESTSKVVSTMLTATTSYGTTDVLVGINGSTTGGVYLSGDGGEHWTQINQGFDPSSLNISTLVKTSCGGCPVQYYSGTYGSGVYTRTIAVNPQPTVTGWCFGSTGCACNNSNPLSGPEQGGQAFRLCGGNYLALPRVEFDGVAATGCTMVNSATITCTGTPPHVPGVVTLRMRNTDTRPGYPKNGGGVVMPYTYTAGAPRNISLTLSKFNATDVQVGWSCPSGCATTPTQIYRSQNAVFTQYLENYTGATGTSGNYLNAGALASHAAAGDTYFWLIE